MGILRKALVGGSIGIMSVVTSGLAVAEEVEEGDIGALMDGHGGIEETELDSDSFDESWSQQKELFGVLLGEQLGQRYVMVGVALVDFRVFQAKVVGVLMILAGWRNQKSAGDNMAVGGIEESPGGISLNQSSADLLEDVISSAVKLVEILLILLDLFNELLLIRVTSGFRMILRVMSILLFSSREHHE